MRDDMYKGRDDVIIYTRDFCGFCDMAKKEITNRNWEYIEYNIGDKDNRAALLEAAPEAKTVPQIWVGNNHIGGYTELMQYFEDTLGY